MPLTKAKKKGREHKERLIGDLRECLDSYANVFLFSVENMRNDKLKEVRAVSFSFPFAFAVFFIVLLTSARLRVCLMC